MDFVIGRLQRSVTAASEDSLNRGMHFPVGWDPYFKEYMTLRDVYHYATQHYDHHRRQLTVAATTTPKKRVGYPKPQVASNVATVTARQPLASAGKQTPMMLFSERHVSSLVRPIHALHRLAKGAGPTLIRFVGELGERLLSIISRGTAG
jgi:hypothetical protein